MRSPHTARLDQARLGMAGADIDALVVTHLPNAFYLSGFTGSNGVLAVLPDGAHLFTDSRYTTQAREEVTVAQVHITKGPLADGCGQFVRQIAGRKRLRVGFDPAHLTVEEWERMKESRVKGVAWKPVAGLVEELREVKSPEELAVMRQAARLGSEVMNEVIAVVRPGVREVELAAEIEYRMRAKGASGVSFESIVASGVRSALPHAQPTEKRLQKKELVVIDLGAILRHYCSDLTRTVYLGRAPAEVRRWYRAVLQAQESALDALRAGGRCGEVDRAARRVLRRNRLEKYFVHSTGHGLGIEVHEIPRIGRKQAQTIRPGSVVTLEPGIYVEGVGGIRIEDDVAVHAGGTEVLTNAPRDFLEL